MESEDRPRPVNDLPQVSRERSKAPVLFRSRAGRGSRTVARARANSGAAHWNFRARPQMDSTQSHHGGADSIVDRALGGDWDAGVESRAKTCTSGNRSVAL